MALEEDIYEMYRDGPFDWFNPIDFMTSTLTGGPSGSWSEKTHSEKIFEIAKQYFTIRDYRAAIKANDNFIAAFPGTKFREESLYIKFKSLFEIAVNSIFSKKEDRLNELQQQYNLILRYYPDTVFIQDMNDKMKKVNSK